jgi:glycosyltransferase involved in cell wall biosynthesis
MEGLAKDSALFAAAGSISRIPLGIDPAVFTPRDRTVARQRLEIPEDAYVICFGAATVTPEHKGFAKLVEALSGISKPANLLVIVFGAGQPEPLPATRFLGMISDAESLSYIYSAADLFVFPSLQDAFGQTTLEAMACGVPVVGFPVGAVPDLIRPMETGLIARTADAHDLGQKIQWMMEHPTEAKEMGRQAREFVATEFTIEQQTRRYVALYSAALKEAA